MKKPIFKKTLNNTAFCEVNTPYQCFIDRKKNIIVIANFYSAVWLGRNTSLRNQLVHIYDLNTLKLISSIDNLKFPINDIAFHPTENILALGIGSYDGGAYFEGELLLWNYQTNTLNSILKDNREVTTCKFSESGKKLFFTVNPTDDLDCPDYTDKTYEVLFPLVSKINLSELSPLTANKHKDNFDPTFLKQRQQDTISKLKTIAKEKKQLYENRNLVWDLKFSHNKLYACYNDSIIEIWDLKTFEKKIITLEKIGDCVELFVLQDKNQMCVNLCTKENYLYDNHTILYEIEAQTAKELFRGKHLFSKTIDHYFLARQISYTEKELQDYIFDPNFKKIFSQRLGHFDLFNHSLRIDNAKKLYYLVGQPLEQHQNKILTSIDPHTLKQEEVYHLEKDSNQYNDISGIIIEDIIILNAKVYRSKRNEYGKYELIAIDLKTKKEKWFKTCSHQITSFEKFDNKRIIASFTNGDIEILEIEKGKTLYQWSTELERSFPRPLSLALKENLLAIGLTDGRILIYEIF